MIRTGFFKRATWSTLPFLVGIFLGSGLVACGDLGVNIRVKPLSAGGYPPKPQGAPIDELSMEPSRPYDKIAKLIATTRSDDEEAVRAKIVEKARSLGADAVVMGKADILENMGHPRYQSTLTSEVPYSIFTGGPGSGIPLFFDPWTYEQTSSDGTTWTMYLSGVAIHYVGASS